MGKEKQKDGDNATIYKEKLANVLGCILSVPTPLKEDIATSDWLELKRALNPINNMITKELTIKFIKKLKKIFKSTPDVLPDEMNNIEELVKENDAINVNGNGYDFKKFPIVAEVKANIPYEGNKYGASQKTGLKKDLNGLATEKGNDDRSEKKKDQELKDYYKFLVVLDYNRSEEYKTLKAVENLISGYKYKDNVVIIKNISQPPSLDKEHVYIVMLKL